MKNRLSKISVFLSLPASKEIWEDLKYGKNNIKHNLTKYG
jgi:hypothetical protein